MRRLLATSLLFLTVALTGCGGGGLTIETTPTTEFVPGTINPALLGTFDSEFLGISAQYPLDWAVVEDAILDGLVEFYAPLVEGDNFVENYSIEVIDLPEGVTLSDVAVEDGRSLPTLFNDYEQIGGGDTEISGEPGLATSFRFTNQSVAIQVLRVVTVKDQKAYFLTFWASAEEFDNFVPVIEQLFNGFVIAG